jgi:hypothetical protein
MREISSPLAGIRSPFGQRREVSLLALYAANGLNPSLVIDAKTPRYFLDGTLSDLTSVTDHSRASGATYLDSNGVLQTAASGEIRDQAYAYVDGVLTGPYVLTEPAGVNLLPYSEDFTDASWVNSGADSLTITPNAIAGPDGNTSMSRIAITDSTNEIHGLTYVSTFSVLGSKTYTLSAFVKADEVRYICVKLAISSASWAAVVFDALTGSVDQTGAGTAGSVTGNSIEDFGGGIYRLSASFTGLAGTGYFSFQTVNSSGAAFGSAGNIAYSGTAGDGLYIYGAQLEEGSTPSSYIPTSGSQGARAADVLTIPDAPWPEAVAGPELVTNGTFDTDTDWAKGTGWSIGSGVATASGGTSDTFYLEQNIGLIAGKLYQYQFTASGPLGGTNYFAFRFGGASDDFNITQAGTFSGIIVASGSGNFRIRSEASTSTITIDNVSVKEISPRAIGISMKGLMTGASSTFADWTLDANNGIQIASGASDFTFTQEAAGVLDSVTGGSYTSGINVPVSIASYHKDNGINGAVDGVALTENTTPTILPDLSATPIQIRPNGGPLYLEEMRIWVEGAVDKITDVLIEEAS